ncbi:hypothetical protein [Microbacterium sp. SORGH_AS_0888]|uniref:hypothetical protein n=1 Tax=Microbacterium sp. SORGH_AS_0888 TaxID=3041791 RepID=UPI00277D2FC2|nr:hypothetical protein [Microbacterium sp. SORGH_AS_0888]MDQ1128751.1 hypothetical protein [Microbacterium sp. SORGH_AS_0888]
MPFRLLFPDADAAADALTFAGRAGTLGTDTAVRLQARAGVLVMTTAALAPRTLLDDVPTVLAMRVVPVDPELECDLAVAAPGLVATSAAGELALPETSVTATWAGISPPRSGWEPGGEIAASVLSARAQWGMTAVAHELPVDPGEDLVRTVRAHVWGAPDDQLLDLPRAVAFAAVTMGFVHGEEQASLRTAPGWSRLTLRRGHVLVRRAVRAGLTPVRATGAA